MTDIKAIPPSRLYGVCNPELLGFNTTEELEALDGVIGQERALEAIKFGIGIQRDGYNLYVLGSTGLGKYTFLRQAIESQAAQAPVPDDWCYIHNFENPQKPRALKLPSGQGQQLHQDMKHLVESLLIEIPAAFESERFRGEAQRLQQEDEQREQQALEALNEKANKRHIKLLRTPNGFALVPMLENGQVISPDEYKQLSEEEQQRIDRLIEQLSAELKEVLHQISVWNQKTRRHYKQLKEELTRITVEQLIAEIAEKYANLTEVGTFLDQIKQDIIENVDEFRRRPEEDSDGKTLAAKAEAITRYQVNVLVDNSKTTGSPVIYADNPTYQNLIGRIEHIAQFGTLKTNFTLIKPGALHCANGGYLILDARKLLTTPFAWAALKRVLHAKELRIESVEQMLSMVSTVSLEPQPIPLNVKVAIVGDRLLCYLLKYYDPEFDRLFKVAADFAEEIDRSEDNIPLYARLIATLQRKEELRFIDREGVARIIEHCARRANDAEKLSLHMGNLTDLLREADYWSGQAGSDTIRAEDVQHAIDNQLYRLDQMRERLQEQVLRGILMIDTSGEQIAAINGLTVIQLGDYRFGHPVRITATARLGRGAVVDIEREAKLGGAIHSKGVMILSAYLASRYAQKLSLSLSASLVFEQSYGKVEGDSASVAELCALLSALADLPISQSLAVTGSVNQLGQVQAIGGVNEKIEGFFDICNARGLTGKQGVIIPQSNIKHLMLRRDVVAAAESGLFNVYGVTYVDEAIALLTNSPAGEMDEEGRYPEDSVNGRVQRKLREFNELSKELAKQGKNNKGQGNGNGPQ